MDVTLGRRRVAGLLTCAAMTIGLAACGGSSSTASSTATSAAATSGGGGSSTSSGGALGAPDPAKGSPVVFGMINVETNAGADFPEVRESAQAAIDYVNAYRGGLDGHPIKLVTCITDGQPATSASCATKLVADHPVADLGGADIAQSASLPILARAGLAQIGGVDLTPAESSAKNSVIFADVAQTGNADIGTYAVQNLHAKKVSVIAIGDNQGIFQAQHGELPGVKGAGGQAKMFPLPPSQADASSVVSSALAYDPDVVEIESPSQCVAILTALKSLGNTKPIMSIDPCSAPPGDQGDRRRRQRHVLVPAVRGPVRLQLRRRHAGQGDHRQVRITQDADRLAGARRAGDRDECVDDIPHHPGGQAHVELHAVDAQIGQ